MTRTMDALRAPLFGLAAALLSCGGPIAPAAPARAPEPAPTAAAKAASKPAVVDASEEGAEVPISAGNPTWGSRDALVTIVEFADLECPFCARVDATMARIREEYGPDTVRIVWKNNPLPFHPSARGMAEAAMGVFALAGKDAFWKFYETALHAPGSSDTDVYVRWAQAAGVTDTDAFRAGLTRHEWSAAVDRDLREAQDLGVVGTPTFFINGLPLTGALPIVTFRGVIDAQVREAQARLAAGTSRDKLYVELTSENRKKAAQDEEAADDQGDDDDSSAIYRIPVGTSPARGPRTALVTIVEFADYQCPFCARVEPTLRDLRARYGDQLRFVFKDAPLPFHPRAEPAAEAALEVRAEKGDAAFWAMHDALLAGSADLSDDGLAHLAATFGARPDSVKAAIVGRLHRRSLEADGDLAEDFSVNGTPHFFINGRRLVGALPEEQFASVIDQEISRGRSQLASGTKPDALYDALVANGATPPPPEMRDLPASLPASDPGRGAERARVTVHEWSDFQCPFCKEAEPTLEELVKAYGDKVRLVWHDLPLPMHPDARNAALAAREALAQKGPRAFWTMHDQMFAHQQQLTRADLDGEARALGLDMAKWSAALDGATHADALDADEHAAESADVRGTPSFLVVPAGAQKGYFVAGAQPYATFRRLVERALSEAK